jgi:hypothetical protein
MLLPRALSQHNEKADSVSRVGLRWPPISHRVHGCLWVLPCVGGL